MRDGGGALLQAVEGQSQPQALEKGAFPLQLAQFVQGIPEFGGEIRSKSGLNSGEMPFPQGLAVLVCAV